MKTAVVICAIVLGAGIATLATGSPNPLSWGHNVLRSVSMGTLVLGSTPIPRPAASGQTPDRSEQSDANASSGKRQGPAGGGQPSGQNPNQAQGQSPNQAQGQNQDQNQGHGQNQAQGQNQGQGQNQTHGQNQGQCQTENGQTQCRAEKG
jgi:hypothetical protein